MAARLRAEGEEGDARGMGRGRLGFQAQWVDIGRGTPEGRRMAATATAGAVAGIGAAHDPPCEQGGGGSALGPAWWLGGPSGPGGLGCLVFLFNYFLLFTFHCFN